MVSILQMGKSPKRTKGMMMESYLLILRSRGDLWVFSIFSSYQMEKKMEIDY